MQHTNKLRIILKYKYLFLFIIIILCIIRVNSNKSNILENETFFIGIVESYTYKNDYLSFILNSSERIKCNYYGTKKIKLKYGDKIYLKGRLKKPINNTIPGTFNYKNYLNNNGIYYILEVSEIKKVIRTKYLIYKLKNIIEKRVNKIDKRGYLNTFILGNKKYIDQDIYNNYYKNGVTHLFSVSGMHISLLASIILFLLNKIKNNNFNNVIVMFFLIMYMFLTNYQPSIVRSVIFYSLLNIKVLKKNFDLSDILLLTIIMILIIKPNYIYDIGFIYSSVISYTLVCFRYIFNKSYFKNILLVSIISFLVSLPITVNINYQVNILSVFINILFVPFISFIIYPLSLIVVIIPSFYIVFDKLISLMELLSSFFSKITLFNIVIPKLDLLFIIIYYLLLLICFKKNKGYIIVLILIMFFVKLSNYYDKNYNIYFLDVGQGDMTVIKNRNKTIVIDTGGSLYDSNYKRIDNYIKFFNFMGSSKIDYLIFTHGDYDHMGEAINLVNNFKVEKLIINCGPYNDLEKELIKVLNKKKIKYYSCIKELNIDNNKLYFLQTKEYDNENDNSNVIYTELNGYKFMFMGDAGIDKEKDILNKYNISDIDVLKVGHHGSKTSSGKKFIYEINPKYSIISVGKNNRYGHPNKEVLNNLEKSIIYRTDQDGSIMFKIKNNKLKIETCSP